METDDEVLERTLRDLSRSCGSFAVVKDQILICSRYAGHPDKCRTEHRDPGPDLDYVISYEWWGANRPVLPHSRDHVWKTVGTKHTLLTRNKRNEWPPAPRDR